MKYLTIRNKGVCPVEGFTVLGVSTARGNSNAIGQFGSGAKHGILTCLRMGLNPVIYSGRTKIQFHTQLAVVKNSWKEYTKVLVQIGTKAPRELSIALEYGELDWTGVEMALREFISNALDAVDGDPSKVEFKIVERIHSDENSTIIGVPLTPEVQRYYNELPKRFLQFSREGKQYNEPCLIVKEQPGPARIYRKGVFIRSIDEHNSIFDYNFGDELRIDESRNLDDYSVTGAAVDIVTNSDSAMESVFRSVVRGEKTWEVSFGGSWRTKYNLRERKEEIKKVWQRCFGENAVASSGGASVALGAAAKSKGFRPLEVPDSGWMDALIESGIPTLFSVLDDVNDSGHQLFPATPEVQKTADTVWEWLSSYNLTRGKTKPPVCLFRDTMNGGAEKMGYYKDGKVHIELDHQTNKQVMLEEMAHYITGACDCTRDFQDYAFRVAACLME